MFIFFPQTESDEEVIFVSEKGVTRSTEIIFDKVKLLALQREIDQQSQPKEATKPLKRRRSVGVEGAVNVVKMKIEEDKVEENFAKKKKHKKEHTSLPENNNCPVNDESLEVKNKKKKKTNALSMEKESLDEGPTKKEKKKKKKSKIVSDSLNDAEASDVRNCNGEVMKKKKKKTKLADDEDCVEISLSSVKEEKIEKKVTKKKKVQDKSVQTKQESLKMKKEEEDQQAKVEKLPKKAKKAKQTVLNKGTETKEKVEEKKKKETTSEEMTKAEDGISAHKKKKKTKTKAAENEVKVEIMEMETSEAEELKVKKKKKKADDADNGSSTHKKKNQGKIKAAQNGVKIETLETETDEVKELKVKKKKNKLKENEAGTPQTKDKNKTSNEDKDSVPIKKQKSAEIESVIQEDKKTELKKKGRKEKGRKASLEVSEIEETEPRKKKRKKTEEEEQLEIKSEEVEKKSRDTSKKNKRKKSSVQEETEDVSFKTSVKKKKVKEEMKDEDEFPQADVVFMSEKSGNTDEVTINQERRVALQMEIDQASQPPKPAKPAGFGQWSTAQFDSSDQQQKFLRLMGGFKKGFQPASGSSGAPNMALGKDAQQKLQQGLLGEFERAQSRRMDFNNRGAGLGFSAPSNKKFSIDVNTCRSVRFDD